MAINTQKFLPAPKSSALAKIEPKGGELAKITQKTVSTQGFSSIFSGKTIKNIGIIKVKVIQIEKILKGTIALEKKSLDEKKRKESGTRREKQEEKLETKPNVEKGNIKMPSAPRLGILDWVKNFIGNIILGYFAVRLIDHLPKIIPIVKFLGAAADFIIDIGGKFLNGLVTFIDIGYKAYDATRGLVKNLFGKRGENQFDQLSSTLNTFLNTVIIAGMLFAGSGGFGGGPKGGGPKGGGPSAPGTRGTRTISGGGPQGRPDVRNPLRQTPKVTTSGGGGAGKPDIRNPLRQKPKVTTGGGGGKFKIPSGSSIKAGGIATLVMLIPDLISSGMLISQGRPKDGIRTFLSAVAAVGAGMAAIAGVTAGAAALGITGVGLPAAIALAIAGFAASSAASFLAYEGAEALLKKMGLVDNDPKTGKPYTYKGGGITRGGKTQGRIKRTIKKPKRTIRTLPSKVKPGQSIGGEKKIKNIFPEVKSGDKGKKINPYGYMKSSYEKLSSAEAFGGLFALPLKAQLGEEPSKLDYQNAASGLNSWMQKTFSSEIMRTGGVGFAEGGSVNAGMFSNGEDLTKVIEKSLEDSISSKVTDSINDLKKQLGLKPDEGKKGDLSLTQKTKEEEDSNLDVENGEFSVSGGNADFWSLVAVASREDGDSQGQADVAQSIYNRVASGIYGANTIKGIVTASGQYEPTFKNTADWKAITDIKSASIAAGKSESELKKVAAAITNKKYQDAAREFVGGRTDFMGGSNKPGPGDKRREENSPNNFFGWFVGPAAIAYGKKNPGPARAPKLGDVVVMGSGGGGAGGSLGGSGQFIQGNSGASRGVHFHIGPGSQVKGSILQSQYFGDARSTAKQAINYFLSKGSKIYDGRRGKYYSSANEVDAAQQAHTASGSAGGIDMQVDFEKPVPFPLKTTGMSYRPNGFGVSADISGSNSFVAHGRYDESGRKAPQTGGLTAYAKGGETKSYPHLATLGEKGKETVIDADSTKGLASLAPNLLEKLNAAKTKPQLMKVMQSYMGGDNQIAATYGGAAAERQQKIDAFMNQKGMPAGKGFQGRFDMFGREYDTNTGKLKLQASNKPSQDTQIAATYGEGFPKKNFMDFLEKDYQKNLKNPIKNNTNDDSRPSRVNALPLAQKSLSSPQIASYASYEQSYPSEVFIPIPIPVPTGGGGNSSGSSGGTIIAMGGGSNPFDSLYKGG